MKHRTMSVCALLFAAAANAQTARVITEADYADRLRGMWLGECIANWTGLRTEGRHREPPFLTDADWGLPYNGFTLDFTWYFSPWPADDDTDIEYVYLHEAARLGRFEFTPVELRDAWLAHINRDIWVSNRKARDLMGRGVLPPATGMGHANVDRLMIDAQLTTELFGAAYPGMPELALEAADLPIRTTAAGYAAHAAQFYVVLYALATEVDPALSGREKAIWLVEQGLSYIPESSKSADVIRFVLDDFLANPDPNNWELTRDRIDDRYRVHAAANGFVYRDWFESSVNLATGVMALLYGQCDYRRTVQVGTMSGWDSDNGTATMGGLLGLMGGRSAVQSAFPGSNLSDLYDIDSRRDNMPDYVPQNAAAEDTLTMMAQRMLPLVRANVENAGGVARDGVWALPPRQPGDGVGRNPLVRLMSRSANNRVRAAGGNVTAAATVTGAPAAGRGVASPGAFADGRELQFAGAEELDAERWYFSTEGAPAAIIEMTVAYDRVVEASTVRIIEGDHFSNGGWALSYVVMLRVAGSWVPATGTWSTNPTTAPFGIIDFNLSQTVDVTGVRIVAASGGQGAFVTCAEIDVLASEPPHARVTFDRDANAWLSVDDLYEFERNPTDLDGDGAIGDPDRAALLTALRAGTAPR
ncbi:MAG: ADP-ribosylglycohydrolase family protein [Phycisphaerales bacterium]